MTAPLLEAVGLAHSFGEVSALRDAGLSLAPGELAVVSGASGSGKTTLMRVLAGLDTPSAGSVRLLGEELVAAGAERRAALRRAHLGFIYQDFRLVEHLTARDNARLSGLIADSDHAGIAARADALLERFGLADLAGRRPAALSRGEMQRVALARALAHRPSLILADEPTASLDPASRAEVWKLLGELNREEKVAILVATHDAAPAGARLLRIEDGRLLEV